MKQAPLSDDQAIVEAALRELAAAQESERHLPDPSFIWWKAQLLRRLDAERQATEPIEIGERVHIAGALVGLVALVTGVWPYVASTVRPPAVLGVALAGAIVLISAVTLAAWQHIRR